MSEVNSHIDEPACKRLKMNGTILGIVSGPISTPRSGLDISKYIPAGCLRMYRAQCSISNEVWNSCDQWRILWHPHDGFHVGNHIQIALQQKLFGTSTLLPYATLHSEAWIRLEFKTNGYDLGQIRVYILPDDIGRSTVARTRNSLRKALTKLLAALDFASATWNGIWSEGNDVLHVDSSLDKKDQGHASLFYMFNTLPSPDPKPEFVVSNPARNAMHGLLNSDVEGLKTTMYQYQRRSAALMLQRESQPTHAVDPRLKQLVDHNGAVWYCDYGAATCLREPRKYENPSGGILAETMGLGKTLICLALILATKELSSQIPAEYSVGTIPVRPRTGSLLDMAAAAVGRTGTAWKSHFAVLEEVGYDYTQCKKAIKRYPGHYYIPGPAPRRQSRNPVSTPARQVFLTAATLIVVPANLIKQWELEIKKHTNGLKVLVIIKNKTKSSLPPAEELAGYDIILLSKQRFEMESSDGLDQLGRSKSTTFNVCHCPYIGSTRERDCSCFRLENIYHSPLKKLHFKRLIADEGHGFGNASRTARTEASTVIDFLQVSARWIVSGTPTAGLYGVEVSLGSGSSSIGTPLADKNSTDVRKLMGGVTKSLSDLQNTEKTPDDLAQQEAVVHAAERKDLEKLGNIAVSYLKAKPWSNTFEDCDSASWPQYMLQPRHGTRSQGHSDCLRSTLEGMIIRHRPEDVQRDVVLPPLYQSVVNLEGSLQDKLSLNMFSMMIVSNAVTSERKDADYLFHSRHRKHLNSLVSNLRQASFHWSGYTPEDVKVTVDIAKEFLAKREVLVPQDEALLEEAIHVGEYVLANSMKRDIDKFHEMPMYVENEWAADVRESWSLDTGSETPTLIGATMAHSIQKFVGAQLWKEDPMEGLVEAGKRALSQALDDPDSIPEAGPADIISRKSTRFGRQKDEVAPGLSGGVTGAFDDSKAKRVRKLRKTSFNQAVPNIVDVEYKVPAQVESGNNTGAETAIADAKPLARKPKSALRKIKTDVPEFVDSASPLASTAIISTSSAKLSYSMDQIALHQEHEKILVFYESENVAYYMAQALECLHIKHLIYAKTLDSARKAQYVVTFNQTETFRVLIMDISQAAFGLDISSASRVYFVSPVFSPQVEVQAVKRAHRIGQTKPVFVETLVLQGSIEEVIMNRRSDLTNEEHNKRKDILDDEIIYDWIRKVRFLPIPDAQLPGRDQMARLVTPQPLFQYRGTAEFGAVQNPDADLLVDGFSPKCKRKVDFATLPTGDVSGDNKTVKPIPLSHIVTNYTSVVDSSASSTKPSSPSENDEPTAFVGMSHQKVETSKVLGKRKDVETSLSERLGPLSKKVKGSQIRFVPSAGDPAVGSTNSRASSSFKINRFRFEGEPSGFFSNDAGSARGERVDSHKARLQLTGTSASASTSVAGGDNDKELSSVRKIQRNSTTLPKVFRKQSIGLKVGDKFQPVPKVGNRPDFGAVSSVTPRTMNTAKQSTAESITEQAQSTTNNTPSLVVKLAINNRGRLQQIEQDSRSFRSEVTDRGATMGPYGWSIKVLMQPPPNYIAADEYEDQV
ncbi:SNF2 family N-terminal domain-containing protein [Calycina marina]|uniref:SNF2 family N-terminal domain-containing protein n=1 Tax=Calycina marina TaxID=1763456 RepID=A0A9P8CHB1_9HELO|nr:SNF2 family N-terminal domain-containing protein [Calycina marina]